MKILSDKQFEKMQADAASFQAIVSTMVESGEDITAEDITAETVIQALQEAGQEDTQGGEDLHPALDASNARISELEGALETANTRIAQLEQELDETPAETAATISSKGETTAEKQDILDFAKKNADDPFAVLAECEKQGYL